MKVITRLPFEFEIFGVAAVLVLSISNLFVVRVDTGDSAGSHAARKSQATENKSIGSAIYGRAVYDDTERAVARASVVLRSANSFGPEEITGTTNARGEFRIERVPAGRYFIGVNSSSVVAPEAFLNTEEKMESRFYVDEMRQYFQEVEVDGKADKHVLIRARRGAVISGKVSYANGDPAVDHPVTVLRRRGDRYSMFWTNVSTMQRALVTDDRGRFRIMGLPDGEYIVGATPMLEHGELVRDEALEANMVGSSLAMIFYPSTPFATQATSIRIRAGEERTTVDITLADQERYRVSGVVRGRDDQRPVADAKVNIVRKETHERVRGALFWPYSVGMPGVKTDALGRWRLTQVPDGRYIIVVKPPSGYEVPAGAKRYSAKQHEIEVSGSDVSNISIEVSDDSTVSGTVVAENGPLPRSIYLGLEKEGMNQGVEASAEVEGGKFTIRNVPAGEMYFYINVSDDTEQFYIKSITWKGKNLLRELLDVGVETKVEGVEIVLSRLVSTFAIRVRNDRGEPVRDVALTLVPADPARWIRTETQLFGTTDSNGRCTITGAPGEYLVFILPVGVQSSTVQKNEIAERAAKVQRVSAKPGERKTFDLLMRPIE